MNADSLKPDADSRASAVDALAQALGLRCPEQGVIGIGKDKWVVQIWDARPTPDLQEFQGMRIDYRIGGGMPEAW